MSVKLNVLDHGFEELSFPNENEAPLCFVKYKIAKEEPYSSKALRHIAEDFPIEFVPREFKILANAVINVWRATARVTILFDEVTAEEERDLLLTLPLRSSSLHEPFFHNWQSAKIGTGFHAKKNEYKNHFLFDEALNRFEFPNVQMVEYQTTYSKKDFKISREDEKALVNKVKAAVHFPLNVC